MARKAVSERDIIFFRDVFNKSNESRDKALLTICTAALGFSLSLYEKVYSGHAIELLFLVWVLLTCSMLCTIYSFSAAAYTADLLNTFNSKKLDSDSEKLDLITSIHKWMKITTWLNKISLFGFTIGVILFVVFSIVNLTGRPVMSNDPNSLQKGIPPLTTQIPALPTNTQKNPPPKK